MWLFLKHLFQLLLAPSRGWEDVSASGVAYDALLRRGYFPLVVVTGASEFVQLVYSTTLTFVGALESAVAVGGGLFASLYAARLYMDMLLPRLINEKINLVKANVLTTYMLGLDCLYRIFSNLLPASLTFLSFLPLLSVLVLFKSMAYMGVDEERTINYLALAVGGVVILPLVICCLLLIII